MLRYVRGLLHHLHLKDGVTLDVEAVECRGSRVQLVTEYDDEIADGTIVVRGHRLF